MEKYIQRIIDIQSKLKSKSLFLFGPRQTGKSSLIANQIQDDVKLSWSLLNARIRRRCQADPGVLRDEIATRGIHDGLVIIDEIQKVPELLDEVHLLIEETDIRFLLTGSSARRLKEQGVNLLGGRAGKMNGRSSWKDEPPSIRMAGNQRAQSYSGQNPKIRDASIRILVRYS